MKKNYSFRKIFISAGQLFVIGLLSLTVGCKDEPARLTGDVLPDGEMIKGHNYNEHILATQNIKRESVRTSDATYGIIGEFKDPIFGKSKAGFLTNFSIGNKISYVVACDSVIGIDPETGKDSLYLDVAFDKFNNNDSELYPYDKWSVDSVVISLKYQFNNWYGNMFTKQDVNIYELNTPIGIGNQTDYFSDHIVDEMYNIIPIAQKSIHPNDEVPKEYQSIRWDSEALFWEYPDSVWNAPGYLWEVDSAYVADGGVGHQQSIKSWDFKLNAETRDRIFDLSDVYLSSTNVFESAFMGIYVALDENSINDGEGSLTKVNLNTGSANSDMTIHFNRVFKKIKELQITGTDTVPIYTTDTTQYTYLFPINMENNRFNTYSHVLNADIIDIEDDAPERLYIQGMAGSYMKMELPDEILTWADSIKTPENIDEDYHMVSNIEFFMEIAMDSATMARYPTPDRLTIKWEEEDGDIVDPVYTIVVNGNEISTPVFGGNTDSQGNRTGTGERVGRYNDNGDLEYLYRFIMRADYFNYIMRNEDGAGLEDKVFYVGPESTTSNFQRVILYSGSTANEVVDVKGDKMDKRMKMNIKYYQYRPR